MVHGKIGSRPGRWMGRAHGRCLDTPHIRMMRTYERLRFLSAESFRGYVGYDANGLPVVARAANSTR